VSVTEFRWMRTDPNEMEERHWSDWHQVAGSCLACCCGGFVLCRECGGREHQEPGEGGMLDLSHGQICQTCRLDALGDPAQVDER